MITNQIVIWEGGDEEMNGGRGEIERWEGKLKWGKIH